MLYISLVS